MGLRPRRQKRTDRAGVHAVPDTSHDAADDQVGDRGRRGLEGSADTEHDTPGHDYPSAAKPFSEHHGQQGAKETADLVDGDDGSLERRTPVACVCDVDLGKLLCKRPFPSISLTLLLGHTQS